MRNYVLLLPLSFIFIAYGCNTNTAPQEDANYMFLNVGDTREYYLPDIDIYMMIKITGTTKRADNQVVYIGEWSSNSELDSNESVSYYFIKDGYFRSTYLDTVNALNENETNPFNEQKLAKIKPVSGDTWQVFDGSTDSTYAVSTVYIGSMETPASSFGNVFAFEFDNILSAYYARGVGHIGAKSYKPDSAPILANYIKVNNEEYGKIVPIDSLPKRSFKLKQDPFAYILGKRTEDD